MSGPVIVLEPLPIAGVKTCEPNLMPFHIAYTGPALISTFMDVKPAKEEEPGTPAQQEPVGNGAEVSSSEVKDIAGDASTEDKKGEVAETGKGPSSSITLDAALQNDTPTNDAPTNDAPTNDAEIASQSCSPSNRTVSTFRGRIIQGLKVDLPAGYRGLVLQAPPAHTTTSGPSSLKTPTAQPSSKVSSSKSKSKAATQGDVGDEDDYPTTRSTRRRGRLTRSAVSTKVVDVEKEEEEEKKANEAAIDVDQEEDSTAMDLDPTAGPDVDSPQRRLKPVAQFSSFTVWHPDNPVVETQDEYYRSVHEWTALAAVLHQGEDEEE